ncbi:MAG: AAC(3) family N-acetyltransferase [Promethearchaeota archaeon]
MSQNNLNESPLFKTEENFIYKSDFITKLKQAGVKKGDCLFIHSDIRFFGKLVEFDENILLSSIIDAFKEVVGATGTLIMPTFTYDFSEGRIFDVNNSKSTVGVLTEFFRKLPDVIRTNHPILSVAIWGENKDFFLDISKDSYGKNSIFGKLHKCNAKIVLLGTDRLTYLHYIEKYIGVPYRYSKEFEGTIINGECEYNDKFIYYVRYLDRNIESNSIPFQKYLLKNGSMKSVIIGNSFIHIIEADLLFREGIKIYRKNPLFFLKKNPNLEGL